VLTYFHRTAPETQRHALPAGSQPWGLQLFGLISAGWTPLEWSPLARRTLFPADTAQRYAKHPAIDGDDADPQTRIGFATLVATA
jgi:hypothetical protein